MFGFLKRGDINQGVEEFKATKGAFLIDVRSSDEYKEGHIPRSLNISGPEIAKVISVVEDNDSPIFVYCLSGARSGSAARALENMGYTNVKNIGGISSYKGQIERGN